MTWTHELDWQGHHLTLTRNASEPKPQTSPALPPAPGAGDIRFPALYLYSDGEALHLEAEISGDKIARVYLDVYFEAEDRWLAGPLCRCELAAPQSREIGGVNIPMWAESNKLSAIWKPAMHLLVSRESAAWGFAQALPSKPEELWLHAMWISDDKEQAVRLSFSVDGKLTRMVALGDNDSLPRSSRGLLPLAGDQLIPAINWLCYERAGWQTNPGSSNAIAITEQPPHLEIVPAAPGRYHIGLLAHDLDGQAHRGMIAFEMAATG